MPKNNLITLQCFEKEIGRIGFDENRNASFFQYNADFIKDENYLHLFPLIFKKTAQTQVFDKYNNDTFRGLPPMIADSLPDTFGNTIFKAWLENSSKEFKQITALEQLAYVGKRGMGALEYLPAKDIKGQHTIDINEITEIVTQVLNNKYNTEANSLNHTSLLNIFKIGTSAGGARPKILISEHQLSGTIIPGDLVYSADYNHYLVKLGIEEGQSYRPELIEYTYYQTALFAGINMMHSKLIDNRHFATRRYDRKNGRKSHVLTATGLTGWDFTDPKMSSYEHLFELAVYLKVPHKDIEQLYKRMIFNLVFANYDDHLKNHSFIYDETLNVWNLAPAYDLTYSLNPLLTYTRTSRALSINNKRTEITLKDVIKVADKFTVKNPNGIIEQVQEATKQWIAYTQELPIPAYIIDNIRKSLVTIK